MNRLFIACLLLCMVPIAGFSELDVGVSLGFPSLFGAQAVAWIGDFAFMVNASWLETARVKNWSWELAAHYSYFHDGDFRRCIGIGYGEFSLAQKRDAQPEEAHFISAYHGWNWRHWFIDLGMIFPLKKKYWTAPGGGGDDEAGVMFFGYPYIMIGYRFKL